MLKSKIVWFLALSVVGAAGVGLVAVSRAEPVTQVMVGAKQLEGRLKGLTLPNGRFTLDDFKYDVTNTKSLVRPYQGHVRFEASWVLHVPRDKWLKHFGGEDWPTAIALGERIVRSHGLEPPKNITPILPTVDEEWVRLTIDRMNVREMPREMEAVYRLVWIRWALASIGDKDAMDRESNVKVDLSLQYDDDWKVKENNWLENGPVNSSLDADVLNRLREAIKEFRDSVSTQAAP